MEHGPCQGPQAACAPKKCGGWSRSRRIAHNAGAWLVTPPPTGQHGLVTRRFRVILPALAMAFVSAEARAEPVLRPSLAAAYVNVAGEHAGGGYATFAAGYNVELEPILVMPELAASFGGFGGGANGFGARLLGGARIGATLAVEPALILRGGYGHVTLTDGPGLGLNGGAIQVGAGLDYRSSRDLTFGGELVYDAAILRAGGTTQTIHSVLLGGTVAFWL